MNLPVKLIQNILKALFISMLKCLNFFLLERSGCLRITDIWEWAGDYCLMPKWAFFLANICVYHGKNKIWGDDDGDVHFVLDQNTELDFYCATMYLTETTVCGYTCHSTRTHYHDSEPINLSP
jgi:hypothetical protein